MIFKPSEITPLSAIKLAEIYTEAGLPPGVFSVVQGSGLDVGQRLPTMPGSTTSRSPAVSREAGR